MRVCVVNKPCWCFVRAGVCSVGVERENVATEFFFSLHMKPFLNFPATRKHLFLFNVPHKWDKWSDCINIVDFMDFYIYRTL